MSENPNPTIKKDPRNARRHNDRNRQMIEESIASQGFGRSILLAADGTIIAGNATADAAESAGIHEVQVIESDGKRVIAIKRTDVQPGSDEFYRLAIADNRSAELADWDPEVLASIGQSVDVGSFFTDDEFAAIASMVAQVDDDLDELPHDEHDDSAVADTGEVEPDEEPGSLLKLVNVTIAEPRHEVTTGDVWNLGPHVLVCVPVMDGWSTWMPFLDSEDCLFCPYPGPFAPLTIKAKSRRLVMVQPSKYIAGHILDRYAEVKGDGAVQKRGH